MRRVQALVAIISISFVSCRTPELARTVIATGYDFSSYTKKGFMFTPEQYLQPYEAIGIVELTIIPEVRMSPPDSVKSKFRELRVEGKVKWMIEEISSDFVLKQMYLHAVTMGADAVVRLKIETIEQQHGELVIPTKSISGFAIKRK